MPLWVLIHVVTQKGSSLKPPIPNLLPAVLSLIRLTHIDDVPTYGSVDYACGAARSSHHIDNDLAARLAPQHQWTEDVCVRSV